jgi:hypothetical protein
MMLKQDLIESHEIKVSPMKNLMVLIFLGMELILLPHMNMYMMKMVFDQMVWFVLNNCAQVVGYIKYVLYTY